MEKEGNHVLSEEMVKELINGLTTIFNEDIEKNMLNKWGDVLPFYKNIKEEGIVLWKAA